MQGQQMEDDLMKELLDNGLFIALVPTALYSPLLCHLMNGDPTSEYSVAWATNELRKAHYHAEAGQLHLLSIGVPTPLRGFTQSVLYFKKVLTNQ